MTIREVISQIDEIQDNEFSESMKCRWVSECEARIWSGIMLLPPHGAPDYRWEYDADRELLLPQPYDELYLVYLSAKIYLSYRETENYQNAMTAFNKLYDQASIWYAEAFDPAHGGRMPMRLVPTFRQGESVTVEFRLPYMAEHLSSLSAAVTAGENMIWSANREDMAVSRETARFTIPQEQTLYFPVGTMTVTIAGTDLDGQRFEAWPPLQIRVVPTVFQEVLT